MDLLRTSIYLTLCWLFHKYILEPALISPLSRIPNAHFTSPFSNAWIHWQRYRGSENKAVHDAHTRLGPIVRLGATEVSVNRLDGVKFIYVHDFDKPDWYRHAFDNYGVPNMFSTLHKLPHATRKRMLANVYSKTTLFSSPEIRNILQVILLQRLLPILESAAEDRAPVDVLELSLAFAMDFINAYLFGLLHGANFLQDLNARKEWLRARDAQTGQFWPLEFPNLTSLLAKLGIRLVSRETEAASEEFKGLCLRMLQNVASSPDSSLKTTDIKPTGPEAVVFNHLFRQLREAYGDDCSPASMSSQLRLSIASELMDHIKAGTETSGWTLTYLLHELSQRPSLQRSLRAELLSVSPDTAVYPPPAPTKVSTDSTATTAEPSFPAPRALDSRPLLDAVIHETLRLHPAVAGSQPRITPHTTSAGPVTLVGYTGIPAGIRVSAQAYSLHRNEEVFPNPETWRPERWLDTTPQAREEMMRWFWAFGSGARMCIGNHFALLKLKAAVAAICTNYTTEIVDDEGIEQMDGYSAGPRGNKLILRFARAS